MITFTGKVSAQVATGEAVTITVTKPAGGTDIVATSTLADGSFTTTYNPAPGNGYTAMASVVANAVYKAATSSVVTFNVALLDRTITLSVA